MKSMENTVIYLKKSVKLKNPILVVGLPGVGNVGKLVAEQLIKEFKGERIATLHSPHLPHEAIMLKSGGIRLINNRFYLLKPGGKSPRQNDIVVLTGDSQAITPEGQYEMNSHIVDFFKEKLHGKFIYTIGGYNASGSSVATPRVFANASSKKVIEGFKDSGITFGVSRGAILGSAGMIVAFSKIKKIDAICLMGESALIDFDPMAAKAVLVVLSKRLSLPIKTDNIDSMVEKTAKALKELESQLSGSAALPHDSGENKTSYIR